MTTRWPRRVSTVSSAKRTADFDRAACAPAFAHAIRAREVAMKAKYKIAAAMIGSFALGVGAASVLYAQAKPPAYLFAEVDVKDWRALRRTSCRRSASRHEGVRRKVSRGRRPGPSRGLLWRPAARPASWSYNSRTWTLSRHSWQSQADLEMDAIKYMARVAS